MTEKANVTQLRPPAANGQPAEPKEDGGTLLEALLAVGTIRDARSYVDLEVPRLGEEIDPESGVKGPRKVRVRALTSDEYRDADARARNNSTGRRDEQFFFELLVLSGVVEKGPPEDPIGPNVFRPETLRQMQVRRDVDAVKLYFYPGDIDRLGTAILRAMGFASISDMENQVKKRLKDGDAAFIKTYMVFKYAGISPKQLLRTPAGERAVLLAFGEKLFEDEIEDKKFQAQLAGAKIR
jgi:hypothetical protein